MTVETRYKICPLCSATCGLDITTNGRNVLEVRASQADSFSQGHICPKGIAIKELDADPDRLRSPMIRRGSKWREATWDEAFAEIDRNISRIVAEHGRDGRGFFWFGQGFSRTPLTYISDQCNVGPTARLHISLGRSPRSENT